MEEKVMVDDILYVRAKAWFKANGHNSVTHIIQAAPGVYADAPEGGYSGRDGNGNLVAVVAFDDLSPTIMQDFWREKAERYFARYYPSVDNVVFAPSTIPGDDHHFYHGYCGEHMVSIVAVQWVIEWNERVNANGLFVLQYAQVFTRQEAEAIEAQVAAKLNPLGYTVLVLDSMGESKVQAFGIDTPHINSMSLDEIEALLDGVRRAREASDPDRGFNS